ncbi:hypothetical protein [Pseudomonas phage D6]|nr:hypothetical protein [Pseudomonas phage D6]
MKTKMYVRKLFAPQRILLKEDCNIAEFSSAASLEASLIHRARCVMGFRGVRNHTTVPLNGNALQHGMRMILGGLDVPFLVDEPVVAEYARHIADETIYWNS